MMSAKKSFQEVFNDDGIFIYADDGFSIELKDGIHNIKWREIDKLVAYKTDLLTTDEICLDIIYGCHKITISEDTPGWYQFVEKSKLMFNKIDHAWDTKIMQPAFETNLTIIYEKQA
jgi:hypothetical protein